MVAQSVEQQTFNLWVEGSNPSHRTTVSIPPFLSLSLSCGRPLGAFRGPGRKIFQKVLDNTFSMCYNIDRKTKEKVK